ncbi:MAG TPA: sigma-70 family RNA polymerase sigma factor [Chloroflexi bacterium]|nr:sigma-70 family RNA polymerase sigma factor [Chloroflexota bacterium]
MQSIEDHATTPASGEEQIIARAAAGDLTAFNQLVVAYQNLAYSVAYRTLQDDAAAADVVQESFIKAYRGIAAFQGGSFKSWIIRIVANTCYDLLRSRQRKLTDSLDDLADNDDYAPHLIDPADTPQAHVERMELSALIERSFQALPPDQRLVLTLCDVHGYAYDEIAEMTGAPMGTIKSRINRARARVRDYLLQYPELLPPAFRPMDEQSYTRQQ